MKYRKQTKIIRQFQNSATKTSKRKQLHFTSILTVFTMRLISIRHIIETKLYAQFQENDFMFEGSVNTVKPLKTSVSATPTSFKKFVRY